MLKEWANAEIDFRLTLNAMIVINVLWNVNSDYKMFLGYHESN